MIRSKSAAVALAGAVLGLSLSAAPLTAQARPAAKPTPTPTASSQSTTKATKATPSTERKPARARAATPPTTGRTITSSGPLTKLAITPDLNCYAEHAGDTDSEWYGDTACGTFVAVNGVLYGPSSVPAGSGRGQSTPFTPVSQSEVTGNGTAASPFRIETVVALGDTGLRLTQVDTYVTGQESARTDVKVTTTGAPADVIISHAGDCYLQNDDDGRGEVHNGNSPVCRAGAAATDPNRIEGFYPLTADNTYFEGSYSDVWRAIGAKAPLPNTVRTDSEHDNGIAVAWAKRVTADTPAEVSLLTVFSPVGIAPVTFTKTAGAAQVAPGGEVTYTVKVANPGPSEVTLQSITDTLPAGFAYKTGSTTGAITTEPRISDRAVTWTGSYKVPAANGTTPGTLQFTFTAKASTTPGTYTNSVTGVGEGVTVIPATDTAPVRVGTMTATPTPTPSATPTPTWTPQPTPSWRPDKDSSGGLAKTGA